MADAVNWRTLRYTARLAWSAARSDVIFLLCLTTVTDLALPLGVWLSEHVVNLIAAGGDRGASPRAWLPWAAALAASFAAQRVLPMFQQNHQRRLTEQISRRVERTFLRTASRAELGLVENSEWHEAMLRASRSVGRQSGLILGFVQIYGGLISSVSMLAILASLNPLLVLIALGFIVSTAPERRFQSRIVYNAFDSFTDNEREQIYIKFLLTESMPAKDIRAYRLAPMLLGRHDRLADSWIREFSGVIRRLDRYTLYTSLATAALALAAYAVVISGGLRGGISPGGVAAAIGAFASLVGQFSSMSVGSVVVTENARFLGDFFDFLPSGTEVSGGSPSFSLPPDGRTDIEFDDVHFTYPGASRPALDGLSLHIRAGELTAIVGGNGSGKSTLVKLLLRFYEPGQGTIRLGGLPLSGLDPEHVRGHIGVLFQDFMIFDFTVRENVLLGRAGGQPQDNRAGQDAKVRDALKAAQAMEIIDALPAGLESPLGHLVQDAQHLSGGELQRVALARLIFRDAGIWILDEPTSALDAQAEAAVFGEVRSLLAGRTGIIISHRFSTVRQADRIVVLDAGRVIESGTHKELLALGGRYAELFEFQAVRYD